MAEKKVEKVEKPTAEKKVEKPIKDPNAKTAIIKGGVTIYRSGNELQKLLQDGWEIK